MFASRSVPDLRSYWAAQENNEAVQVSFVHHPDDFTRHSTLHSRFFKKPCSDSRLLVVGFFSKFCWWGKLSLKEAQLDTK